LQNIVVDHPIAIGFENMNHIGHSTQSETHSYVNPDSIGTMFSMSYVAQKFWPSYFQADPLPKICWMHNATEARSHGIFSMFPWQLKNILWHTMRNSPT